MATRTTTRQSAEERRASIIAAATAEFSRSGLHGTSTHAIAKRAGISQPYIFQLFATKQELFLAACDAAFERIRTAFTDAVAADPENPKDAMGIAYVALLQDRDTLLMQLHAYAASYDPEVRDAIREEFGDLLRLIERLIGTGAEDARDFVAHGMLLNVIAALDLPELAQKREWVARMLDGTGIDCA